MGWLDSFKKSKEMQKLKNTALILAWIGTPSLSRSDFTHCSKRGMFSIKIYKYKIKGGAIDK
jgi:hypothetical protein